MRTEVLILGGGYAGLAAALYLGRARVPTVLVDAGLGRNRFARHAQGFLGMDGLAPAEVRRRARADVAAYPAVRLREGAVGRVRPEAGGFVAEGPGGTIAARSVILAGGMRDLLPDLPGLAACWGLSAIQCPYCHGYELADRPTVLLLTHAAQLHQALILPAWTRDLTILAEDPALADAVRAEVPGLPVVQGRVVAVAQEGGQVTALHLADGRRLACGVLYLASRQEPSDGIAEDLGCAMDEGPFGRHVRVDMVQATSVPGVLAAGDLTRPFYGAAFAAADGVRAAMAAHRTIMAGGAGRTAPAA